MTDEIPHPGTPEYRWWHAGALAEAAIVRALAAIHTTGPDPTDWQRGWRACADHATRALNGKTETQP